MEDNIYILIHKKLKGEDLNSEELKEFKYWHRTNEKDFLQMQINWDALGKLKPKLSLNTETTWDEILIKANNKGGKVKKFNFHTFLKLAAAILLIGLVTYVLVDLNKYQVITSDEVGNKAYLLPDASSVWLNDNSKIKFVKGFASSGREVSLEGEAFFEVKRDISKPFSVLSSSIKVEVLGTKFNLLANSNKPMVELMLVEGKVSFENTENKEKLILLPGERLIFNRETSSATKIQNKDLNTMAWKEQKLVFRNTPIQNVIEDLERYFKQNITVKNDKLFNCSFTSTFDNPELEEVLEILKYTMNLKISRQDDSIEISGTGCK